MTRFSITLIIVFAVLGAFHLDTSYFDASFFQESNLSKGTSTRVYFVRRTIKKGETIARLDVSSKIVTRTDSPDFALIRRDDACGQKAYRNIPGGKILTEWDVEREDLFTAWLFPKNKNTVN